MLLKGPHVSLLIHRESSASEFKDFISKYNAQGVHKPLLNSSFCAFISCLFMVLKMLFSAWNNPIHVEITL